MASLLQWASSLPQHIGSAPPRHIDKAQTAALLSTSSFSCSSEAQLTSTANLVEGMSNVAYVDAVALLGTDLPDLQAAVLNPESIAELALKHNNSSNTAGKAHANVSFRQRYAASLSKSSTVLVSVSHHLDQQRLLRLCIRVRAAQA